MLYSTQVQSMRSQPANPQLQLGDCPQPQGAPQRLPIPSQHAQCTPPRPDSAQLVQTHLPELTQTHCPKSHNLLPNTKRNHLFSKEKSNINDIQYPFILGQLP